MLYDQDLISLSELGLKGMRMVFLRWWCRCFSELRTNSLPCHLHRGMSLDVIRDVISALQMWILLKFFEIHFFCLFPHKEIHFPFSSFCSLAFLLHHWYIELHYYPKPLSWWNISWYSQCNECSLGQVLVFIRGWAVTLTWSILSGFKSQHSFSFLFCWSNYCVLKTLEMKWQ